MSESDLERPYFMTNSDWYYFDDHLGVVRLTKKGIAIKEVAKSYEEYYKSQKINGIVVDN